MQALRAARRARRPVPRRRVRAGDLRAPARGGARSASAADVRGRAASPRAPPAPPARPASSPRTGPRPRSPRWCAWSATGRRSSGTSATAARRTLTDREREILGLIAGGATNREIAKDRVPLAAHRQGAHQHALPQARSAQPRRRRPARAAAGAAPLSRRSAARRLDPVSEDPQAARTDPPIRGVDAPFREVKPCETEGWRQMSTLETSHTAPARPWPLTRTAGIAGIGAALPERLVPNAEIAARLGVDEDWIVRRTGIRERRYAAPGAARQRARREPPRARRCRRRPRRRRDRPRARRDLQPTRSRPRRAAGRARARRGQRRRLRRRHRLHRLARRARAATAWIEAGRARHVLVIGAEIMSRHVDPARPQHRAAVRRRRRRDRRLADAHGRDRAGRARQRRRRRAARSAPRARRACSRWTATRPSCRPCTGSRCSTEQVLEPPGSRSTTSTCSSTTRPTRASSRRSPTGSDSTPERVFDCIAELGNTCAASVPLALERGRARGRSRRGRGWCSGRPAPASPGARRLTWVPGERRGRERSHGAARESGPSVRQGCALVTGGSRGIGAAIAARSPPTAGRSPSTTAPARTPPARPSAAIQRRGGRAVAVRGDVTAAA